MNNKNILEICLSPDLGGLELFMLSCIKSFSKNSKVFTAVAPNKKLFNYLDDKNSFELKRNKFFPMIPALKLAKYIDKNNIDVVHFHWTRDIATVILAKKLSKKNPQVVQSRHMSMTRFKDDFYHKWLYKNIYTMHAVTHQVKEQLEKFIPFEVRPNIEVVHPGTASPKIEALKIDKLREKYNLNNSFVLGIIGRIEEGKGQYLVIEAIAKLKNIDVKALIVGQAMTENYLAELKGKIADLGIENQVIFTGFTKEVNEHIQLCDVTVLATPKETFGLVVIESMANGVPVIATNNGGPLEIITDKVDGLLFDRSTTDLVEKIELLYGNQILKEKIKREALHSVKTKFNQEVQLTKLYEVLNAG